MRLASLVTPYHLLHVFTVLPTENLLTVLLFSPSIFSLSISLSLSLLPLYLSIPISHRLKEWKCECAYFSLSLRLEQDPNYTSTEHHSYLTVRNRKLADELRIPSDPAETTYSWTKMANPILTPFPCLGSLSNHSIRYKLREPFPPPAARLTD